MIVISHYSWTLKAFVLERSWVITFFNEFFQDPDSSGIQGPLGPRMCRMGDVRREVPDTGDDYRG